MRMPEPGSGPIPAPHDFPVSWSTEEDVQHFWFWDMAHHPQPVTPLTGSLDAPALSSGFTRAAQALSLPLQAFKSAILNNYWYMSAVPLGSPQDMAARLMQLQGTIMEKSVRALDDWNHLYLPEVHRLNQRLRDYPYAQADLYQLADLLDEARAMRERQFEIHSLVVFPVTLAASIFAQFYEGVIGPPEDNEHYQMLGGFPNKTMEAGQALYDLAAEAPDQVAQTVRDLPAAELLSELDKSALGREFRTRLDAYLDEFGWRSDAFEFMDPSWREEPTPVLYNLKSYLRQGATDPRQEQAKAANARESLVAETMDRLAGSEAQLDTFRNLLQSAQTYLPIQENHNFYIDQQNTVLLRRPFLELGRRLAEAGAIGERDDIFYLTHDELPQAATQPGGRDWASLVAQRRAERERWAAVVPPRELGTPPPEGPQGNPWSILFFGQRPEPSRDPKVINGIAASAGTVTATARVVRSLSEAHKLQPGDALVCEMTMPAWTPLFASVAAVVADSGGVLSHCAIVAREYRVPCVVGTQVGTQLLKDGQRITVDGAQGIVRIEG